MSDKETFHICLNALVANARATGGVVEIRGSYIEEAYGHGGDRSTTDEWPVVYGSLERPALRPGETVLYTPGAILALEAAENERVATEMHIATIGGGLR